MAKTGWHHAAKKMMQFRWEAIEEQLNAYQQRLNSESEFLIKEQKKLDKLIESHIKDLEDEQYADNVYDYYEQEIEMTFRFYPSLSYNSLLLSLYAFLEGNMKSLVNELHHIGYEEMKTQKNAGINQYKGHIGKIKVYNFKHLRDDFTFVEDCRIIRNCLIHTNGELSDDDEKQIAPLLKKYNLNIRYKKFGINEKDIIQRLLDTTRGILVPMIKHIAVNMPDSRPSNH